MLSNYLLPYNSINDKSFDNYILFLIYFQYLTMTASAATLFMLVSLSCMQGAFGFFSFLTSSTPDVVNSPVSVIQTSSDDSARSNTADIDLGNVEVFGSVQNSDFEVEQVADDNVARSKEGDLNIGNIFVAESFRDSDVAVVQTAEDNSARSGSDGIVNTGNYAFFGNLRGNRRLLFHKQDPFAWFV
eukprot:TRINITY_DN4959_c0_g2_i1.p2 TRINITY_DN4959_c0_g2~~TRINITY_DN4959_c0_g2_i1.p2  ORF type:complete len:187 (+),score=24.47 TRINITY_DN4959_c0_g2_i1:173-733(+)